MFVKSINKCSLFYLCSCLFTKKLEHWIKRQKETIPLTLPYATHIKNQNKIPKRIAVIFTPYNNNYKKNVKIIRPSKPESEYNHPPSAGRRRSDKFLFTFCPFYTSFFGTCFIGLVIFALFTMSLLYTSLTFKIVDINLIYKINFLIFLVAYLLVKC